MEWKCDMDQTDGSYMSECSLNGWSCSRCSHYTEQVNTEAIYEILRRHPRKKKSLIDIILGR